MLRTPVDTVATIFLPGSAGPVCRADSESARTCAFAVKARCASGEARATYNGNELTKLAIDVFWCGLRGKLGYSCLVDDSRNNDNSNWAEASGVISIANKSPGNPSLPNRIKVTVGKLVSIDLEETQLSGKCGAGAEPPRAIQGPPAHRCHVAL